MLGKLLKHEFKETGKLLIPLNLILIAATILGMIALSFDAFTSDSMIILSVSMLLIYIIGVIALAIVTYIYLIVRFYKTEFSDQGYLTHTLPVSQMTTFNVKLLTGFVWMLINMILTILSIVSLILSATDTSISSLDWSTFSDFVSRELGYSTAGFVGIFVLLLVISCFSSLLDAYASMSIGQLFNKHKVAAGVITYVIFYFIIQIISTIVTLTSAIGRYAITTTNTSVTEDFEIFHALFTRSIILSLVMCVIFYVINAFIITRKLNLD